MERKRGAWVNRAVGCGLALALFGVSSSAWGDARSEARRHFERGMELIAQSNFDEGVAELEEAYATLPHPAVLYNIARAWRDAGELEKSLAAYRRYLESDPPDRAEVEAAIENLEERIAAKKTKVAPPKPAPGAPEPTEKPDPEKPDEVPPEPVEPEVPLVEGEAPPLDIYEEQVVTASRQAQSTLDSPNSTAVITRQDIRLSGEVRIPELLRRVAGMDVMQITGGDANVSMRGLNSRLSNKLLVLVDGRRVTNDVLGATFWETLTIDVDQIERIEVVRGPGSSLYGADAFAGVVNIITIPPGEGGPGFRVGMGDHAAAYGSAWASGREGDFGYRLSAGYTRHPRWTREAQEGRLDLHLNDIDQNVGSQSARINLGTVFRVGKQKVLEVGGGFARTDLELYGIGPFNDMASQLDTAYANVGFSSNFLNIRSYYSLLAGSASQNHDYLGHTLYRSAPEQHLFATDLEVPIAFEGPEGLEHGLLAGLTYRLKNTAWNYLVADVPIEHHVGLFAQESMQFLEHYNIVLSGRLDYVPFLETVVPSGRATFIVKPGQTKRQAIKASVGTAFRTPTFLEAYLDIPIQLALSGLDVQSQSARSDDPSFSLGAENILAAEVGYLNQLSDDFQFEIGAYYHRISDYIVLAEPRLVNLSNLAAGIGGLNPETGHYLVGFGGWENECAVDNVFGGEVGARYYGVEGLDLFANYAVNYGLQEQAAGCLVVEDQKTSHHKVNVGTQLRTTFGLEGEITFHYQTAQVWGEQVLTLDGIETQLFELPDYHLLNGRIGYSFLDRRATVAVTVFNALADVFGAPPQMHPFGNRIGRRIMGFASYRM